jgi:hypothetical protein
MSEWKRPLIIGIGWGFGTAFGVMFLVGGFLWYQSRPKPPKPPKPWNTVAFKADYDMADTDGDDNNIVIYYTLENATDFDYRIEDSHDIAISGKLKDENSLVFSSNLLKIDYPIFLPARKRVRFPIHIGYPYPVKKNSNADTEERKKYRQGVEKYLTSEMGNLDGFELLEQANRYEIIFPAGWKVSIK